MLDYALLLVAILGGVAGAFFIGALLPLPFLVPLTVLVVCFGLYRFYQNFHVEYEYIFTNGELDIDRIIYKKRRKRLLTIDVQAFELLAPMRKAYAQEFEQRRENSTLLDLASTPKAEGRWFAAFSKDGVRTLMILQPNERILDAISKYIPHKMRKGDEV
ncbi:MAG: DUF6106 family protein [Oscillospiraceae bacterium]|nr:DUF6106 family protein [Oscillospiraceae bacterium]